MEFTAGQIAEMIGGIVEGNADAAVNDLAKIEEGHNTALTFLANPAYQHHIYTTKAGVAIVAKDFTAEKAAEILKSIATKLHRS